MNSSEQVAEGSFIPCQVERHHGALLVTFDDGSSILLQTEDDIHAFMTDCGVDPDSEPEYIDACPPEWGDTGE